MRHPPIEQRHFKAILCDLDGTLVDTEVLADKARIVVCRDQYGFEITEAESKALVGRTDTDALTILFMTRKLTHDVGEAVKKVHEVYEGYLQTDLRSYAATMDFLKRLRNASAPKGLVSGSTAKQVGLIIDALQCRDIFDVIVTDDDVEHSKPHPESYLLAAKKLKVRPSECLAIEDSVTGITAAKDAGMFCVGVRNNGAINLNGMDMQIPDLSKLDLAVFLNEIQ